MPTSQSLLLIGDIAGYTMFMKLHRASLAHSGDITGRLLNTVVAACPLPLIEVEGDAAFFCAPLDTVRASAVELALAMHQAFHVELERMISLNLCACDACLQTRNLRLKFAGHVGDVATQTVGGRQKVVGVDVIAVHRMLKNRVSVPEYVLMTEQLYSRSEDDVRRAARSIDEDLEGLGRETLYYIDLGELALERPTPLQPSFARRLGSTAALAFRGFPVLAGLRRPRQLQAG